MPDLTLNALKVEDRSTPQRDGTILYERLATFWLGNHGPFSERFPKDAAIDVELPARVDKLRRALESLHG